MSDFDCAIVGAGFVGAALAIALNRCGLKVIVIDTRTPLAEIANADVRGLALSPSSQHVFTDLGLWPSLAEAAMPIRQIIVSEQGSLPTVKLSAAEFGLEALAHVIPADYLLRTIENQLLSEAKVLWQTSLKSYCLEADHLRINVRESDGEEQQFTAKLLIGADGINSTVRELANISSKIRAYKQQAVVATVRVADLEPDLAIERFTPTGPVALLPSSPGRHVLVRCCRLEETEQLLALRDDEYMADAKQRLARPLGAFSQLGQRRAHPLVLSQADEIIGDRVALVGAAAVTVHPNAAQGLNLGMRDVAELCHNLADTSQAMLGGREQLQQFATNRAKDQRRVIRFTDGLARGFSASFPGLGLVRSLGLFGW